MTFTLPENDGFPKVAAPFAPLAHMNPFALLSSDGQPIDLLEQANAMQMGMLEATFRFWLMPFRFLAPSEPAPEVAETTPAATLTLAPEIEIPPEIKAPQAFVLAAMAVGTVSQGKAPIPEPAPAPEVKPAPRLAVKPEGVADDLERIIGVGPKLKARLNELGVRQFRQIAAWSAEEVAAINAKLGFPGRIEREGWQKQASRLTKETGKSGPKAGSKAA